MTVRRRSVRQHRLSATMGESLLKEDPLSRIQREIIEVTEREREFKEGHFRTNRLLSESTIEVGQRNGHDHPEPAKTLNRAVSTSHLVTGPGAGTPAVPPATLPLSNGYARRFTPQGGTKGIMQRFIAAKGRLPATSPVAVSPSAPSTPLSPLTPLSSMPLNSMPLSPPSPPPMTRDADGRPVRKGYVPVEEKIQKELRELKEREHELRRMRRRRKPFELELSDEDSGSETGDEDAPPPGLLKVTKSIGELYEALNEEARVPSPHRASPTPQHHALRPAKSLAELCELAPGEEFLAPSSTRLIAQWESIIQQKQEAGAA